VLIKEPLNNSAREFASCRLLLLGWLVVMLAACATSPVATDQVSVAATGPAHVLAQAGHEGEMVVWGGRIVQADNFAEYTELVVVSYPLDRADRPRLNAEPGVRFIVSEAGFLEPMKFAPGRFVTVLGRVAGIQERAIGEYLYEHPLLEAEQIHLWPADPAQWRARTGFSIGIGIRL
jgi:outer membrane lipoprotein